MDYFIAVLITHDSVNSVYRAGWTGHVYYVATLMNDNIYYYFCKYLLICIWISTLDVQAHTYDTHMHVYAHTHTHTLV